STFCSVLPKSRRGSGALVTVKATAVMSSIKRMTVAPSICPWPGALRTGQIGHWAEGGVTGRSPLVTRAVAEGDNDVTPPCHHACHPAWICDTRKEARSGEKAALMDADRPAWARRMTNEREV